MTPRLPWLRWPRAARGAGLAACLWLAGAAAALSQGGGPVHATYDGPTTRYPHAVLGDAIEYTGLTVTLGDGRVLRATLDPALVFEDLAPRLVDLDGDGAAEIVTVESHAALGARLAIWSVRGGALHRLIATPHIGQRFRWLAPVAAADLDGDGRIELAYVDRPHLARTLRVWRFERAGGRVTLSPVAALPGVTNHRIGWDYITGGLRACPGTGAPAMILASGDWGRVLSVRLAGNALQAEDLGPYSPAAIARALACP
jgi:hypothetical protein